MLTWRIAAPTLLTNCHSLGNPMHDTRLLGLCGYLHRSVLLSTRRSSRARSLAARDRVPLRVGGSLTYVGGKPRARFCCLRSRVQIRRYHDAVSFRINAFTNSTKLPLQTRAHERPRIRYLVPVASKPGSWPPFVALHSWALLVTPTSCSVAVSQHLHDRDHP